MKEIRLKYHADTGIKINYEINDLRDHECNSYDYIVWLENQLDNPIGVQELNMQKYKNFSSFNAIDVKQTAKALDLILRELNCKNE